jgi:hypothetical protein
MISLSNHEPVKPQTETAAQVEAEPTISASRSSDGPRPSSADVEQAKGAVAFIIGLNGYHCIDVIDTQSAGSGVYDVTCIIDHHGHRATYMVNSRTNDVAEL